MEQIKYSTTKCDKDIKFHYINCEIEHTGEAEVSKFFEPAIVRKDDSKYDVSFRGRPFNGKSVKLPDDYIVSNVKASNLNDAEFLTINRSDRFTYWNFDQQPDVDDNVNQAINWFGISKTMMGNVTMDELNEFN